MAQTEEKKKQKVLEHQNKNCANCGGSLVFSPKHQALFCENCKSTYPIEHPERPTKHVFDESVDFTKEKTDWSDTNKVLKCSNCGANIVLGNLEYAKFCPYCQSPNIAQTDQLPGLKPDNIIPFKFDQADAKERFCKQIRKKWFLPSKFKKFLPTLQLVGTYVTSFVFDAATRSAYSGTLSYTTTETHRTANGEMQTRTVTHYVNVNSSIDKNFSNLVTESSSLITQNEYHQIYPYDFAQCTGFSQDYLRGFVVEHYQQGLQDCNAAADSIMDSEIRHAILRKHHCENIVRLNLSTTFLRKEFSYTLLPIYFFEYTYKQKSYRTLMNGQTGKIGSNVPRSGWKIGLLIAAIVLAIAIPIILIFVLNALGIGTATAAFG